MINPDFHDLAVETLLNAEVFDKAIVIFRMDSSGKIHHTMAGESDALSAILVEMQARILAHVMYFIEESEK